MTEPADWRRHTIVLLQRREIDNLGPVESTGAPALGVVADRGHARRRAL